MDYPHHHWKYKKSDSTREKRPRDPDQAERGRAVSSFDRLLCSWIIIRFSQILNYSKDDFIIHHLHTNGRNWDKLVWVLVRMSCSLSVCGSSLLITSDLLSKNIIYLKWLVIVCVDHSDWPRLTICVDCSTIWRWCLVSVMGSGGSFRFPWFLSLCSLLDEVFRSLRMLVRRCIVSGLLCLILDQQLLLALGLVSSVGSLSLCSVAVSVYLWLASSFFKMCVIVFGVTVLFCFSSLWLMSTMWMGRALYSRVVRGRSRATVYQRPSTESESAWRKWWCRSD